MLITPEQIRAARALLRIDQKELARRAHVSAVTIRRLEASDGIDRVAHATVEDIRRALEQAGAEFVEGGVRRRGLPEEAEAKYRDLMAIAEQSAAELADLPPFSE